MDEKDLPKFIKDALKKLSTIPKQVEELKRSAVREGAMTLLSRAIAYAPELDPLENITHGFGCSQTPHRCCQIGC